MRRHSARLWVQDIEYQIVVDDASDLGDPLMAIFRADEEEPIVTVHLNPRATCNYFGHRSEREDGHLIAREGEGE